jgi:hypothetical protein
VQIIETDNSRDLPAEKRRLELVIAAYVHHSPNITHNNRCFHHNSTLLETSLLTNMSSSNCTTMSPLHDRRKIYVPNQVDEDSVAENDANGESGLEFEGGADLGEVEDMEPESTQEQTAMGLGLQPGKSWPEVEAKLRGTYSGTSTQTSKRRQEEKKESKMHARKFNKMTPKAQLPRLLLWPLLPFRLPFRLPFLLPYLEKLKSPVAMFSHLRSQTECSYEASESDDSPYEEDVQ